MALIPKGLSVDLHSMAGIWGETFTIMRGNMSYTTVCLERENIIIIGYRAF
jgi:hypothetical protein